MPSGAFSFCGEAPAMGRRSCVVARMAAREVISVGVMSGRRRASVSRFCARESRVGRKRPAYRWNLRCEALVQSMKLAEEVIALIIHLGAGVRFSVLKL